MKSLCAGRETANWSRHASQRAVRRGIPNTAEWITNIPRPSARSFLPGQGDNETFANKKQLDDIGRQASVLKMPNHESVCSQGRAAMECNKWRPACRGRRAGQPTPQGQERGCFLFLSLPPRPVSIPRYCSPLLIVFMLALWSARKMRKKLVMPSDTLLKRMRWVSSSIFRCFYETVGKPYTGWLVKV